MKSPLAIVKDKFGDKAKLVEAVKAFGTEELWLGRTSKDRGHSLLRQLGKGRFDVTFAIDVENRKLLPHCLSGFLQVSSLGFGLNCVGVD